MAVRQGVEIVFCSKCRGIWLEEDDLGKIIERSLLEMSVRNHSELRDDRHSQHYDKHHDNYYGGHYKKKKGLSTKEESRYG